MAMTDNELKNTLQSALADNSSSSNEAAFTRRVMSQLPQSRAKWSVVWMIRVLAVAIGLVCLWLITPPDGIVTFLLSACTRLSSLLTAGLMIAGITLFICRRRQIL